MHFDEPVGRSDGCVRGKRVFECEPNFGAFARGRNVQCGAFPERGLLDEDDEEAADGGGGVDEDEM